MFFWPFLGATIIALGLVKLGALAVWVAVLKATLFLILAAVLLVALVCSWRRYWRS